MILSLLVAGSVAAPIYDVALLHSSGAAPTDAVGEDNPSAHLWGVGGAVGWAWTGRVGADLAVRTGASTSGRLLTAALVRPNLLVGDVSSARIALQPGLGVLRDTSIDGTARPVLSAGATAHLLKGDGARPRVGLAYYGTPGQPARLELSVGVARWGKRPTPEPTVAEPSVEVPANAALVWVAQPTCRWMEAEPALPHLRERRSPEADVPFIAAQLAHAPLTVAGDVDAADSGVLVVAALPGDEVWLDGEPVSPSAEGLVLRSRPAGRSDVRIRGAGRDTSSPVVVTAGATVWLQMDDPPLTYQVGFEQGSATLDDDAQEVVVALGSALGNWRVELRGGYSAEGDRAANERLARERALSVQARLVAAGVPHERIAVLEVTAPDTSLTAEDQRTTTLDLLPQD